MPAITVGQLVFQFPDTWKASQYDAWAFYRNQFSRMWNDIKAVDILAIDPDKNAWFIEVKDYRLHRRTKPVNLADEVAKKVFDTMAAMLPAKVNANSNDEVEIAKAVSKAKKIHVVLHLEQPEKATKLTPIAIRPADVRQKLRRLLKPIDPHVLVVQAGNMGGLGWTVR